MAIGPIEGWDDISPTKRHLRHSQSTTTNAQPTAAHRKACHAATRPPWAHTKEHGCKLSSPSRDDKRGSRLVVRSGGARHDAGALVAVLVLIPLSRAHELVHLLDRHGAEGEEVA